MKLLHVALVMMSVVTGYLWRDVADDRESRIHYLPPPVGVALAAPIHVGGFIFLYAPIWVIHLIAPKIEFVRRVEQTMRKPIRASITSIVAIGIGFFLRIAWERGERQPASE